MTHHPSATRLPAEPVILPSDRAALFAELSRRGGQIWITVAGASMCPTLPLGTRVQIDAAKSCRSGDVVLFRKVAGDGYVLHRLVFYSEFIPWFLHIGDARPGKIGMARREQIMGVARLPRSSPSLPTYWGLARMWPALGVKAWMRRKPITFDLE